MITLVEFWNNSNFTLDSLGRTYKLTITYVHPAPTLYCMRFWPSTSGHVFLWCVRPIVVYGSLAEPPD